MGSRISLRCSAPRMLTTVSWLIRPMRAAVHHDKADRARCKAIVPQSASPIAQATSAFVGTAATAPAGPAVLAPASATSLSTTHPCKSGMGKSSTDCTSSPSSPSAICRDKAAGSRLRGGGGENEGSFPEG